MIAFGTILAIVTIQVVGFLISRSITTQLGGVVELAKSISKGDLTSDKLKCDATDEIGQLAKVSNQMLDSLRDLTSQSLSVTENINTAAAEILAATQQQACGTKEQAAAIQQITTTMTETSQSGSEIIERAKQVARAAESSAATSQAGIQRSRIRTALCREFANRWRKSPRISWRLARRRQSVGEIIATVNDIAEQSNLLALNATIEAAAAGSEGSRFSVVAAEMKNLADQAKTCTVQVRAILGEIQKGINTSVMLTEEAVKRVESGKKQADVSESTIHAITETTENSIRTFQQIIGAANQQQIGFEQVTRAEMQDIRTSG